MTVPGGANETTLIGGPLADPTVMGGSPIRSEQAAAQAAQATPATTATATSPDPLAILQRENERKDELLRELLARTPAQSTDRMPAPAVPPKPGAPPDPIREPEKFKQWSESIVAYNDALIRSAVTEGRGEIAESLQRDRLWNDFQSRYGDLASDPALCRYAFQAELERTGGRVPTDERGFVDAIGGRLRAFRGQGGASGTAPGQGGGAQHSAQATAGLSAGSAGEAPRVVNPVTGPSGSQGGAKPFATQLEEVRQKRLPDLFG